MVLMAVVMMVVVTDVSMASAQSLEMISDSRLVCCLFFPLGFKIFFDSPEQFNGMYLPTFSLPLLRNRFFENDFFQFLVQGPISLRMLLELFSAGKTYY